MAKFRYKIGNSMLPPCELLDYSEAREFTIGFGKLFNATCKCYEYGTNLKIYEYKKK